jgi:diguanylate cyclase (GGDEF)-like protein/PAS domain S-box-containing protein
MIHVEVENSLSLTNKNVKFGYESVLEALPCGVVVLDNVADCVFANIQAQKLLGKASSRLLGKGFLSAFCGEDEAAFTNAWLKAKQHGGRVKVDVQVTANNKQKLVRVLVSPSSKNAANAQYVAILHDISEFHEIEHKLQLSQQRYELATKGSSAGIWDWDIATNTVYFSPKFLELLCLEENELGNNWDLFSERLHEDDQEVFAKQLESHIKDPFIQFNLELRIYTSKHQGLWFNIVGEAIRDEHGEATRMVGSLTDITDKKQSQQVIWHQANFDALTQLPNRNMFSDRLNQEIVKCKRNGNRFALLFIDLDHFKEVNDTMGHAAGDLLLVEVAERLRLILRETDTVGRIGGDEFTALITDIKTNEDVEQIAEKLLETIELPFYVNNESIFISASIGITLFPEHSDKFDELLKFADQAMYLSKSEGRKQFQHFSKELQEQAEKAHRLTQELRIAVIGQQFEVLYQPIYDIANKKVHKAEALIRWHHPELGMVSPADFIPIAESSGLIADIGNWVFQSAAKQVREWRETYAEDFQISVNRSPAQFQSTLNHYDKLWFETMRQLGIAGGICIEITEGLLLDDDNTTKSTLAQFRDYGIAISLDDFGTGYASLSFLRKFKIDFLKIDKAFVMNIEESPENQALCEAIIVMAHKLGLSVIAEGVETKQQLAVLTNAGCDYAQGYYISRPVPQDEFTKQLASDDPFEIAKKA